VPAHPSSRRAAPERRFSPHIGGILRFRGEKNVFFVFPQLKWTVMAIIYVPDNWIRVSECGNEADSVFLSVRYSFSEKLNGSRFPNNKEDLRDNADRSQ